MEKPNKKIQLLLFATVTIVVVILWNPSWSNNAEVRTKEEMTGTAALENALQQMEGVGEVAIYFHTPNGSSENSPLSDFFSDKTSTAQSETTGVLVVAEGAGMPGVKSELTQLLSAVLQMPEHRIVIAEMKKRGNHDEN